MEDRAPRVLVADDDGSIRTLLTHVLVRAGFDTAEAADGRQALDQLGNGDFDALVLDLMMPNVNGFEVVEQLIERNPRMVEKTVVLTAFPKAAAKERLHQLCAILDKPFDVTELVTLVRDCARR